MKRFFSLIFLSVFIMCFAAAGVRAAGSASLQGPSVVRAGDKITVTFYAGGGIYGGNGTVSYDKNVLTYQGFTQLIGGSYAVEFGGSNFIFYDNSMASPISGSAGIFSMTFTVNSNVAPGTALSVKASGVTLSDGEQDTAIGTLTYSTTVAPPLSGNCNLKSMTVKGADISPAFSPAVTGYTASVPFATSKLDVTAAAEHEKAKVSISNPALTPGGTTNIRITVTAENGATKTYQIAVTRERDPNYVESSNADLKALSVEGYVLSPAFDKTVTQYYVWLPYETERLSLQAETEDAKAAVTVGSPELLPGFGTDIPVTVTAEDGTQKVYTVTAVRAPEHEKTPAYIAGQREELPEAPTEPAVTEPPQTEPETTAPGSSAEPTAPTQPQITVGSTGYSLTVVALACVLAAALGAGVTVLFFCCRKKQQ